MEFCTVQGIFLKKGKKKRRYNRKVKRMYEKKEEGGRMGEKNVWSYYSNCYNLVANVKLPHL